MMKRNMIVLLAACVLVIGLFFCVSACAETRGKDGRISWVLSDDLTLTLSGTGSMNNHSYSSNCLTTAPWGTSAKKVIIQNGVTSIGDYAFSGSANLTSITIPNSVKSIGRGAFWCCFGLTDISIPYGVTEIGYDVLSGCTSLTTINIPNSVNKIGNYAFNNCSSLSSITLPNKLKTIGYEAFHNCSSLKSITIPDSVTSIGGYAFDNCNAIRYSEMDTDSARALSKAGYSFRIPGEQFDRKYLFANDAVTGIAICSVDKDITSIVIPNGVTSIGYYAFYNCSSLSSIVIPNGVTSIGDYAFNNCSSLENITIPNGVTSIGNGAFYNCSSLETIPNGVTSIGNYAFFGCNGLESITIPNGVTSIGNYAFSGCNSLESVTISNSVTSIGGYAFSGCNSLESVTIPNSVTSIGGNAFYNCSSLESITIPNGVTSIGGDAFENCNAIRYSEMDTDSARALSKAGYSFRIPGEQFDRKYLFANDTVTGIAICSADKDITSIVIPNGVTSIGNSAFYNCSSLESITIPNGVTSIGYDAFRNCSNLKIIMFPESVTSIGGGAFYLCNAIRYSEMDTDSARALSKAGYSFRIPSEQYDLRYLFANDAVTGIAICSADKDITSIVIPNGVTSIGEGAFSGCNGLESITIPNSVTSIGQGAFSGCNGLESITIPNGVTSIGHNAFSGCNGLESITIPNGVTSIGEGAFYNCNSLESITIPNSVTSIGQYAFYNCSSMESITIPNGVSNIGGYTFSSCSNLSSIAIPNSVTSIGSYAFSGCNSLESITIPNSVTSIGNNAFSGCNGLESITIPNGVTSIGSYAFSGCNSLESITIPNSVTSIGGRAFENCNAIRYSEMDTDSARALSKAGYSFRIPGEQFDREYLFANDVVTGIAICSADKDVTSIVIPNGVTSIWGYAFYNCSSLSSIVIPNGVTSIGEYAFYNCSSLESITIPNGVTSIGYNAFRNCSNMEKIMFPESVTSIGGGAFYYCNAIRYSEMDTDSARALSKAGYSFRIPGEQYDLRYLFANDAVTGIAISSADKDVTSIVIPNGVTSIEDFTFKDCSNLINIIIPEGVVTLGTDAFYNCSKLMNVEIPNSVTSMGTSVFRNCSSLTHITIPEGVNCIRNNAFNGCSSLTDITLPQSVLSIENNAFDRCSSLTRVTIPEGCTSIDNNAFSGCNNLTKIAIPECATNFGTSILPNKNCTVYCYQYSAADYWAQSEEYPIQYIDGTNVVYSRSLDLPNQLRLSLGDTYTLACPVFPNLDNPEIIWSSSAPEVVSVENGILTAHETGQATITATCGSLSDEMPVTVYIKALSFDLSKTEVWLVAQEEIKLDINNIEPADAVIEERWYSSNTDYATVDNTGLVTTKRPGDVVVLLVSEKGISRKCKIHVCFPVSAIEMVPSETEIQVGEEYQLTANVTMHSQTCVNHLVTFTSSDPETASVDQNGLVTAKKRGIVDITVSGAINSTAEATARIRVGVCSMDGNTPVDHVWSSAEYKWSDDNSSITATRVCENNAGHIETETVNATSEVTKAATCEGNGETTYAADFENAAFTEQTKTVDNIPALTHNWGTPTYEWAADNSSMTATRVCERDESHVETETVNAATEVTKAATCEGTGETTYTVTFVNEAFAEQTKTVENIPPLTHNWGTPTYEWAADNSSMTATRVCARDESHVETETVNASSKVTKEATCEENGETTYTATFENTAFMEQTKKASIPATGHEWNAPEYEWSEDNSTVTARRSCNNADHPETETVETYGELIKAPTGTESGEYRLVSAVFSNPAFAVQTKTMVMASLEEMNVLWLPGDLTSIEAETFVGSLADAVIIPDKCTTIRPNAFVNCPNLVYVRVPAGTNLMDGAFSGCPKVMIDRAAQAE